MSVSIEVLFAAILGDWFASLAVPEHSEPSEHCAESSSREPVATCFAVAGY